LLGGTAWEGRPLATGRFPFLAYPVRDRPRQ